MSGSFKGAVLLSLLSPNEAASVLRHMDEIEAERLMRELAVLDDFGDSTASDVLAEGLERLENDDVMPRAGLEATRHLVLEAFGAQQGSHLWSRLQAVIGDPTAEEPDPELLAKLNKIPPDHLVEIVRNEHPQAIALVLGFLSPTHGAAVLSALPPDNRADVAVRLLTTESPPTEALDTVRRSLQDAIGAAGPGAAVSFDGLQVLVQILGNVPRDLSQEVLSALAASNPDMADRVRQELFTFEDLINLTDRDIQRVLREVDMRDLALSLRGVSEEMRDRITGNLSKRAGAMLREEIDFMGPVRIGDVLSVQRQIIDAVMKLEEAGEVAIPRPGEEVLV